MDFKGPKEKFEKIAHLNAYGSFKESLKLLVENETIPFEIRTTFHSSLINKEDILEMIQDLNDTNYNKPFYIQNFRNYQNTIAPLPDSKPLKTTDFAPSMTKVIFR